jgi:hypothetical protein
LLYFGVQEPKATTHTATAEEKARLSSSQLKTVVVVVDMQNDYSNITKCETSRCALAQLRGLTTRHWVRADLLEIWLVHQV